MQRKLDCRDVLAYIHRYTEASGRPPSYRAIAKWFDVSPSTAHRYVKWLSDDGLVSLKPGARGIVVL